MGRQKQTGFTIVELLIVVVVIAILAAITIVSYNGITNQAKRSSAQASAKKAASKISTYYVKNNAYPTDETQAEIQSNPNISYQWRVNNSTSPETFCVTVTTQQMSYYVSNSDLTPKLGACAGHGANGATVVTNLVLNPNAEGSSGWATGGSVTGGFVSGFDGSTRAYRMTRSTTGAAVARASVSSIDSNSPYSIRMTLRSNITTTVTIQTRPTTANTSAANYTSVSLVAGVPQTVTISGTSSTSSHTSPNVAVTWGDGVANDWVDVTRVMLTPGSYSGNYYDGNSPGWYWSGSANNSDSAGPTS